MTTSTKTPLATEARVQNDRLTVALDDGRELSAPLAWFPRLERATDDELGNWTLIGPGVGIHWPDVDEHVSVESLLHPERTIPSREIRETRKRREAPDGPS